MLGQRHGERGADPVSQRRLAVTRPGVLDGRGRLPWVSHAGRGLENALGANGRLGPCQRRSAEAGAAFG